jgi:hypothetical protein
MYWLAEHPSPLLSVQGTHEAVSLELLQVHWFTSTWRGLHVVKLHGAHCVASTLVVLLQTPTCHDVVVHGSGRYKLQRLLQRFMRNSRTWYCPGWHSPHGAHHLESYAVLPSHLLMEYCPTGHLLVQGRHVLSLVSSPATHEPERYCPLRHDALHGVHFPADVSEKVVPGQYAPEAMYSPALHSEHGEQACNHTIIATQ